MTDPSQPRRLRKQTFGIRSFVQAKEHAQSWRKAIIIKNKVENGTGYENVLPQNSATQTAIPATTG